MTLPSRLAYYQSALATEGRIQISRRPKSVFSKNGGTILHADGSLGYMGKIYDLKELAAHDGIWFGVKNGRSVNPHSLGIKPTRWFSKRRVVDVEWDPEIIFHYLQRLMGTA